MAGGPVKTVDLFRTRNLVVRNATGFLSEACFVTFEAYSELATLDRPGFGEHFLRNRRIDALHFISRDNDWYQLAELPEACGLAFQLAQRYRRVVAYGSSMGGYAAIRFGGWVGAHTAFALSPQFSIDPKRVPFETRWAREGRRVRFIHEEDARTVPMAVAVYDPLITADARHVELLRKLTTVADVRLPCSGHPSTGYLANLGLLSRSLMALARGSFSAPKLQKVARQRRKESAEFFVNLALRSRGARRQADFGEQAARRAPKNALIQAQFAVYAAAAGRRDEAVAAMAAADALEPGRPLMRLQRSRVHELLDEMDAAIAVMKSLCAAVPGDRDYRRRLWRLRAKRLLI
jgi:hypothetical protein